VKTPGTGETCWEGFTRDLFRNAKKKRGCQKICKVSNPLNGKKTGDQKDVAAGKLVSLGAIATKGNRLKYRYRKNEGAAAGKKGKRERRDSQRMIEENGRSALAIIIRGQKKSYEGLMAARCVGNGAVRGTRGGRLGCKGTAKGAKPRLSRPTEKKT